MSSDSKEPTDFRKYRRQTERRLTIAVVVFLGPVLYHSDRFLVRSLHRISDGLEVPMAWITVAVPLTVVVILIHLVARLVGSESEQLDPKS